MGRKGRGEEVGSSSFALGRKKEKKRKFGAYGMRARRFLMMMMMMMMIDTHLVCTTLDSVVTTMMT